MVPSKAFHFALGSPTKPVSAVWRVWVRDDEVHLAVRTTGAEVTFIGYPTGRWRITAGTAVSRWHRPKEFRPGWTRGPDLIIPYCAVALQPPGAEPNAAEPVTWLPAPPAGHRARLTLLFAAPHAEEAKWRPPDTPGMERVAVLLLRRAGAVHLGRVDEPESDPVDDQAAFAAGVSPEPQHPPGQTWAVSGVIIGADRTGRPSLRESHTPVGPVRR